MFNILLPGTTRKELGSLSTKSSRSEGKNKNKPEGVCCNLEEPSFRWQGWRWSLMSCFSGISSFFFLPCVSKMGNYFSCDDKDSYNETSLYYLGSESCKKNNNNKINKWLKIIQPAFIFLLSDCFSPFCVLRL